MVDWVPPELGSLGRVCMGGARATGALKYPTMTDFMKLIVNFM